MNPTLLNTLLVAAVPVVVGLGFAGVFALLGVWQRANAAAKSSVYQLASAKLETGVETALHALQGQLSTLATQLANKEITSSQFGSAILAALKKDGQTYLVPAVADALGTTLSGLETMALAVAAKKVGLSPATAPAAVGPK